MVKGTPVLKPVFVPTVPWSPIPISLKLFLFFKKEYLTRFLTFTVITLGMSACYGKAANSVTSSDPSQITYLLLSVVIT